MKKNLALLLAFGILLFLPLAPAETPLTLYESKPFEYYLKDDQGGASAVIAKYTGSEQDLAIPETLDGYAVTGIGDKAFYKREDIKAIRLPDTVSEIGAYAFYGCKGLGTIKLPPMLENIGKWAFVACDGIDVFVIPPSVNVIGDAAFSACKKLTAIVTEAGNPVFTSMDGVLINSITETLIAWPQGKPVQKASIHEGIKMIAPRAFTGNTQIKEVALPASLVEIGESAFSGCDNLVRADLPDGLKIIGTAAFYWCRMLEPSPIPQSVENIMPYAFSNCLAAAAFSVDSANPFYSSMDGCLYDIRNAALLSYPLDSPAKEFTVAEGTRAIGPDAFMNCVTLQGLTLPEGLESIGQNAMRNCDALK